MLKFSKRKMIERLVKDDLDELITPEIEAILDDLDGQPVTAQCWNRQVYGEPVLWCVGKSGHGQYVNELDVE